MRIYTIGFTKKTAGQFFEALRRSGARCLLDIRLNNRSQLAGFTKRDDLKYFLEKLAGMEYHEVPALAPDQAILKEYRQTHDWAAYESQYLELIKSRQAENAVEMRWLREGAVLLCSEPLPAKCHRRLAAEYLALLKGPGIEIVHL
ncbi:MAG: DUF488 domain-containing protein [Chloroflexi bacterium]|nr:DUF488 domain-containing protein [Chloroflexota bacterium]